MVKEHEVRCGLHTPGSLSRSHEAEDPHPVPPEDALSLGFYY